MQSTEAIFASVTRKQDGIESFEDYDECMEIVAAYANTLPKWLLKGYSSNEVNSLKENFVDKLRSAFDGMTSDKEIDRIKSQLVDRFGEMPLELDNLFDVVKIRNLGGKLGFEKIIIKNGMMIMFFIANQMSPYYKSKVFTGILQNINANDRLFNIKQSEGKLKIVSRGIDSLPKALQTLNILK